jgi:hypothetical protein
MQSPAGATDEGLIGGNMAYRFIMMNLLLLVLLPTMDVSDLGLSNQSSSPKLLHTVPPFFDVKTVLVVAPGSSRWAIPGFVNLDTEISYEGRVLSSRFVGGNPLLMASTKAAVSQWKFEPVAEGTETRKIQLRFFYDEEARVKISPYEITLEVKYQCPSKDEIEKFESSKRFRITKEQCEVHKQPLRVETVEIVYGLAVFRKGFWKAHDKHFPNDNFDIGGGCVMWTRQYGNCAIPPPQFGEVSFCQKCRETSARWQKQHKHAKFEF